MTAVLILGLSHDAMAMNADGVDIHGFISQGFLVSNEYNYLSHKSTDGSFEYNEIGLNFASNLSDSLRVGMQFFSRDLGDASNNKILLDWAYGDYRWQNWMGIRAGKIKVPLGFYTEIRDVDFLRTSIVLPQGIYNDMIRDTTLSLSGISLYGDLDMQSGGSLDYVLLAGSWSPDQDSGLSKYVNNVFSPLGAAMRSELVYDPGYSAALRWQTPLEGLRVGFSTLFATLKFPMVLTNGTPLDLPASYDFYVGSIEYVWNDLLLTFEYHQRLSDVDVGGMLLEVDHESYYGAASYHFTDLFTLGAYYSVTYPDKNDKDGESPLLVAPNRAWEKDLAVTLRFDITNNFIVKIEGHYVDGTAHTIPSDNANSDYSEDTWYYGAVKTSFSF
ncbi:MAG: hypothetical protein HKP58_12290 [Desulfatitalea sp.]|nr:hypothetical protein [Desulfatitalea sp.]NNK01180.1 hypothetical protein [Desulfatitalea sp.]